MFLKRGAITKDETRFAEQDVDLISMRPHATAPLGKILASIRLVRRLFPAKEDSSQSTTGNTRYASDAALEEFSTGTIIFLGLAMLLGPMWSLEFVSNSKYRLTIITVSLALFMFFLSLASVNRPFEVVAASAAYAAVLMVFMQIEGRS